MIIQTSYLIQDKVGNVWRDFDTLSGVTSGDVAESYYDSLRDQYPDVELRLIQIEERVCRQGKGRVYL